MLSDGLCDLAPYSLFPSTPINQYRGQPIMALDPDTQARVNPALDRVAQPYFKHMENRAQRLCDPHVVHVGRSRLISIILMPFEIATHSWGGKLCLQRLPDHLYVSSFQR